MSTRQWLLLFGSVALAACGGSGGGGGDGPGSDAAPGGGCRIENAHEQCGKPCTSDSSCPIGLYCDTSGVCNLDCSQGGDECGAGSYCNDRGRCEAGSGPVDAAPGGSGDACASVRVDAEVVIPTVYLLIDHSGSMDEPIAGDGTAIRVDAVREALMPPETGVIDRLDHIVRFGAALYGQGSGGSGCPRLTQVAPALGNYQAIFDAIEPELYPDQVDGRTPTAQSLRALAEGIPDPGDDERRIIVLATDGDPNTCNSNNTNFGSVENAVRDIHADKGVEIYVLSVGNDTTEAHLQRVANLGVGKETDALDPAPFFTALDPQALVDAFNTIIRGARECRFTLNGQINDPTRGTVELDGDELELDQDWRLVDESTIELVGEACDRYLDAETPVLEAEFACEAVIIID